MMTSVWSLLVPRTNVPATEPGVPRSAIVRPGTVRRASGSSLNCFASICFRSMTATLEAVRHVSVSVLVAVTTTSGAMIAGFGYSFFVVSAGVAVGVAAGLTPVVAGACAVARWVKAASAAVIAPKRKRPREVS